MDLRQGGCPCDGGERASSSRLPLVLPRGLAGGLRTPRRRACLPIQRSVHRQGPASAAVQARCERQAECRPTDPPRMREPVNRAPSYRDSRQAMPAFQVPRHDQVRYRSTASNPDRAVLVGLRRFLAVTYLIRALPGGSAAAARAAWTARPGAGGCLESRARGRGLPAASPPARPSRPAGATGARSGGTPSLRRPLRRGIR